MKDFQNAMTVLSVLSILIAGSVVQAVNVLWDQSHEPLGGYDLADRYSQLGNLLRQEGYTVMPNVVPLREQGLWDIDILAVSVLSNFITPYTAAEAERVASFVAGGGGLIVLSDDSQSRPGNVSPILSRFNLLPAQNDGLGDLVRFQGGRFTENLQSIFIFEGGAVAIGQEDNRATLIAFDVNNLAGAALWHDQGGSAVLIGDADIWTNDNFNEDDNRLFAVNCFREASRERRGAFEQDGENQVFYLIPDDRTQYRFNVFNRGEGALEIGTATVGAAAWIQASPSYAVLTPGSSREITVTLSSEGFEPDQQQNGVLQLAHNDPNLNPLNLNFTLNVIDTNPNHFTPPPPTGRDHSLLIQSFTLENAEARAGIEIGVFTPEGRCGGASVYSGHLPMGLIARADDPFTEAVEGFLDGQDFSFRIFLPWNDREIPASARYLNDVSQFRTDGLSVLTLNGGESGGLDIEFNNRWSLISFNILPNRLEMPRIFAPLVESGNLLIVKDGDGRFWSVPYNFSNLGLWDITQGYEVCVLHPCELAVQGVVIDPQTPIQVEPGWNYIAYFPDRLLAPAEAMESIIEDLVLLKRDDGAFFSPEWEFDGIGALTPGKGYKASMNARRTLVYPEVQRQFADVVQSSSILPQSRVNMSLLLMGLPPETPIRALRTDGCLLNEGLSGADGRIGLAVWGDDLLTEEVEGLTAGESFSVKQRTGGAWQTVILTWLQGGDRFETDGLSAGRAESPAIPLVPDLTCHPNPFNSELNARVSAQDDAWVTVLDISGRLLERREVLVKGGNPSTMVFSSSGWPAGVVFIRLQSQGCKITRKAVHLP